jgi:hypothetical protein
MCIRDSFLGDDNDYLGDDDGEYLSDDDDSLEDDDELGVDYHTIDRGVQEREGLKDKSYSTGMTGGQELSSAVRLGGTRLRDASGEGYRENPSDPKVRRLRAGEVRKIVVHFKNGRKLIITE